MQIRCACTGRARAGTENGVHPKFLAHDTLAGSCLEPALHVHVEVVHATFARHICTSRVHQVHACFCSTVHVHIANTGHVHFDEKLTSIEHKLARAETNIAGLQQDAVHVRHALDRLTVSQSELETSTNRLAVRLLVLFVLIMSLLAINIATAGLA